MSRQPMSMIGHMHAAAMKILRVVSAPVRFVGRAMMEAAERLIPQGAAELGNALYGKSDAYSPPGMTEQGMRGNGQAVSSVAPPVASYDQRLDQQATRMPNKNDTQDKGR